MPQRRRRSHQRHRHRPDCVLSMWFSRLRVAHHFEIAMIGGDDHGTTSIIDRGADFTEGMIDRLGRFQCGFEDTGMANHVWVGNVADDQIKGARSDRGSELGGEFRATHLRLQVVGRDSRRCDQHTFFTWERIFAPTIEEEGDMRVLLSLGDAQLLHSARGNHFWQGVGHALRRIRDRRHRQVCSVFGQADVGRQMDRTRSRETVEVFTNERPCQFTRTVGAEVEEHHRIAIGKPRAIADDRRLDEFVGFTALR